MIRQITRSLFPVLACWAVLALPAPATADNWPGFRGPGVMGQSSGTNLPETWSPDRNIAWKTAIPGTGWSSPAIWEGRVYITTVVSEGTEEDHKKGLYLRGEREKSAQVHHWRVYALDLKDGKELWMREVHTGSPTNPRHLKNTYASETPVADEAGVYAYFGNLGIFAFDHDGNVLWERRLPAYDTINGWGTGSSPALHKGRLYVVHDNEEHSHMVCLDARSGAEIWNVDRDSHSAWSTPYIWENALRTEIVTNGANTPPEAEPLGFTASVGKMRGYDLDGNLLWELMGGNGPVVPSPFAWEGNLYITTGWVATRYRPAFVLRPGMQGAREFKAGETKDDLLVWSSDKLGPYHPTPIIVDGLYYTLHDRGQLFCNDARTGEVFYERQRIQGSTGGFTASPWSYQGKIFCINEDGQTFVIEAGREYKQLQMNPLEEMCMATPAVSGDTLVIRGRDHVYGIRRSEPEG